MGVQQDLGPVTPSRAAIYAQAVELQALARLAVEFTVPGPGADVPRALRQIARMREVLSWPLVLTIKTPPDFPHAISEDLEREAARIQRAGGFCGDC